MAYNEILFYNCKYNFNFFDLFINTININNKDWNEDVEYEINKKNKI